MFEIKDLKFFKALIQSLSNRNHITIKLEQTTLKMYTTDSPVVFASIESKFFKTAYETEFTLSPAILIRYLSLINAGTVFDINEALVIRNRHGEALSEVTIPFVKSTEPSEFDLTDTHTKFMIKNYKALSTISGIVNYRIENNMLRIGRYTEEIRDELVIFDIEIISHLNLNFTCSNGWTGVLVCLEDYIEKVMFLFGENMLFVQFLLKEYGDSFIEIVVPRCLG